ncbi:MAG TPA: DUF5069 domain-containing protein [Candidatus Didemnitutus sp.]|nr:DUF5069 domain-containing protein [Candidatus Didemnitutus sp.]
MKNYDFAIRFKAVFEKAVRLFAEGKRGAENFFNADELAFLKENGITAQHLYDYAEDQNNYGEPGYDQALTIESIRRDYFLNQQQGKASKTVLDEGKLPGKTEAVKGIEWLPRLIPKARAKLRGELPASLMYCCGGDRKFFKEHDIMPAEFLNLVWRNEKNDAAIVDWVASKHTAVPAGT